MSLAACPRSWRGSHPGAKSIAPSKHPTKPAGRGVLVGVQHVTDHRFRVARTFDGDAVPSDPDRFGEWVRPHVPAMARLAARLAPAADRDDIVQEALSRAWVKRTQFDPRRGTAPGWLLAITADQARKALRRSRPRWGLVDRATATVQSDDRLDIEAAVARLPARQRIAVDCYYFAGLSIAETASVMVCAEGTVKSTLSDARKRLRDLIEARDGH
jgi:RNA polymerase sigma-70 factor (ECF subfamily)